VVPVPSGATTGNVVVTVNSLASNGLTFTVNVAPTLTSLSPTTGSVGTSVTIAGTNFGATQGASTVKFNGTTATPTSWSATSIVVPVPAAATTGNVVVTVNSLASNGLPFTVTVPAVVTASPASVAPSGSLNVSWSNIGTPTATDWVVLVPTGAADTNYVAWTYTTGTGSGSKTIAVPASAAPGAYEVRLFAQDSWTRLAVSNTISIQMPSVTANPSTVAAGGTLTVGWQNIGAPSPGDWLALTPAAAADSGWVAWVYASGNSSDKTVFALPSTLAAGSYQVRLFSNNTMDRLAVSNNVTVTATGPSVSASPAITAPGSTLTVNWRNIAAPTTGDWVGVYPLGALDTAYATRIFSTGRATDRALLTLPGSLTAGTYELRLFSNNTFTKLATGNTFDVGTPPSVSVSPASVSAGGTLNVNWTGIASPTPKDWVVLVPIGSPDANWVAWRYTTGTASGSMGLAIPPTVPMGSYELRLLANDTWQRLAVSNIVRVGPTVVMSPSTVAPGGTMTVTYSGVLTPTSKDWLALVPLNGADANWVAWLYTSGRAADSLTFTLPANLAAGLYDLRLFANDSFDRLALSNVITVTAPGPTLATSPVAVASGGTLTATWQGIAAPSVNNWIGVYAAGAADASFITQVFTNGTASGSTTITLGTLALGSYELRLFANSGFTRLAVSNGFTVIPGPAVHASPGTVAKGGTVTVTWEGIAAPTAGDWFALAPLNSDDSIYVAWHYSTGAATGSTTITVPVSAPSGTYEVRLFGNNTLTRLGVSNVVIVP
jgi:hypothetical protein